MCLTIAKPYHAKASTYLDRKEHVLKKPRIVFKRFRQKTDDKQLVPPFCTSFRYTRNKMYTTQLTTGGYGSDYLDINCGFHAYTTLERARHKQERGPLTIHKEIVVMCLVPKGATFLWNDSTEECVSNKMRVLETVPYNVRTDEDLDRYLKRRTRG